MQEGHCAPGKGGSTHCGRSCSQVIINAVTIHCPMDYCCLVSVGAVFQPPNKAVPASTRTFLSQANSERASPCPAAPSNAYVQDLAHARKGADDGQVNVCRTGQHDTAAADVVNSQGQ